MDKCIVSPVAIPSTGADRGVITKAIEDWAAQSQSKRGELAPPTTTNLQLQRSGAVRESSGLLGWHVHRGVQYVCVAEVRQVALGAWRAVPAPRSTLADAGAKMCFSHGHVGIVGVWKLCCCSRPRRLLENKITNAQNAFLDGGLCWEPSLLGESLHLRGIEVEAVKGHVRHGS